MKAGVLLSAFAVAAALVGPAVAQSDTRTPNAAPGNVPTVTIINKAPTASGREELKVSPSAPEPAATAPAATAKTPSATPAAAAAGDAPEAGRDAAPSAASQAPNADTAPEPAKPAPKADTASEPAKPAPPPKPTLAIDIDLTRQVMTVSDNGATRYTWPISSARHGYRTPTGSYQPTWMAKMWYSRQYDYAPMPHAIFFHKGVAIHGTYATRALGRPASHGCVRLATKNAATLYRMVNAHGKDRTRIVVHGTPDHSGARVAAYEGDDDEEDVVRYRRSPRYLPPGYRYLPPSAYRRGYSAYDMPDDYYYERRRPRRYYDAPRRAPRGLYGGYSYGYGF